MTVLYTKGNVGDSVRDFSIDQFDRQRVEVISACLLTVDKMPIAALHGKAVR